MKKKFVFSLVCIFLAFIFISSDVDAGGIIKLKNTEDSKVIMNGEFTTDRMSHFFSYLYDHGVADLKIKKNVLLSNATQRKLFVFDNDIKEEYYQDDNTVTFFNDVGEKNYRDNYTVNFEIKVHYSHAGDEYIGHFDVASLKNSQLIFNKNFLKYNDTLSFLKSVVPSLTYENIIQVNFTALSPLCLYKEQLKNPVPSEIDENDSNDSDDFRELDSEEEDPDDMFPTMDFPADIKKYTDKDIDK
ncbi:MAG: hypothetical protein FWC41_01515 [Firmicutes bacterium]|nr:hypothetical protein [Bacillota bacterium]